MSCGTNGEMVMKAMGYAEKTKPAQSWDTFLNCNGKKGAITEVIPCAMGAWDGHNEIESVDKLT